MSTFVKLYLKSKEKLTTPVKVDLPEEVGESAKPPQADILARQLDLAQYIADAISAGAISIGGSVIHQQEVEGLTVNFFEVTVNGGLLPTNDDQIMLFGPSGIVLKGTDPFKYQIDRVSTPNRILLNTTPLGPVNLALLVWL